MHRKSANEGTDLTLISNGKALCVIVVPDAPSPATEEGAKILSDHLFQISGAKVDIVKESGLEGALIQDGKMVLPTRDDIQTFILVGEGNFTQRLGVTSKNLGPGGIIIKTSGNALILLGPDENTPSDPWGTGYAVTQFLEDYLGIRYLWPGESGKVVPKSQNIQIPALDVEFTPPIRQRHFRSVGYDERAQMGLDYLGLTKDDYFKMREAFEATELRTPIWFTWHRLGGRIDLNGGHAYKDYWDKYGEEHPEWFALQADGTRDQSAAPDRARLCKSNLELINAIAQEKIEELDRSGGKKSVSISPNDGGPPMYCMCPKCKELDPPEASKVKLWETLNGKRRSFDYVSLSDRMVYFYNAIAEKVTEKYPDAILVAYAYSRYKTPPVRYDLHPNIVIGFASMNYEGENGRTECLDNWDGWASIASQIFWRPNLLWFRNEGSASVFIHRAAEDLRYFLGNRMIGTDQDCCMHHWATQGLNYYIFAKLHWNPALHVDKLINDYCQSGFGSAWKEMKIYFTRMEQLCDMWALKEMNLPMSYTPEVVDELRGMLEDAREAAGDDEEVIKRIGFLSLGLDWTAMEGELQRMVRDFNTGKEVDKGKAHDLLEQRYEIMHDIFKNNHYAINVTAWSWLYGRRFADIFDWKVPNASVLSAEENIADGEGIPMG